MMRLVRGAFLDGTREISNLVGASQWRERLVFLSLATNDVIRVIFMDNTWCR